MERGAPGVMGEESMLGRELHPDLLFMKFFWLKHQCIFTKSWYTIIYFPRGFDHNHTDMIDVV